MSDFLISLDSLRLIPKPRKQLKKRWKLIQNLTWILIPGVFWELTHAASASSLLSPLESIQFHSTLTECREQLSWPQVLCEQGGKGLQNSIHVCMGRDTPQALNLGDDLGRGRAPSSRQGPAQTSCWQQILSIYIISLPLRSGGSNSSTSFILSLLPADSNEPPTLDNLQVFGERDVSLKLAEHQHLQSNWNVIKGQDPSLWGICSAEGQPRKDTALNVDESSQTESFSSLRCTYSHNFVQPVQKVLIALKDAWERISDTLLALPIKSSSDTKELVEFSSCPRRVSSSQQLFLKSNKECVEFEIRHPVIYSICSAWFEYQSFSNSVSGFRVICWKLISPLPSQLVFFVSYQVLIETKGQLHNRVNPSRLPYLTSKHFLHLPVSKCMWRTFEDKVFTFPIF